MRQVQPVRRPCLDPSHKPPMHLYVAPGKSYTHTCPRCLEQTVIQSSLPVF